MKRVRADDAVRECDFTVHQWPSPLALGVLRADARALARMHPETNFWLPTRQAERLLAAKLQPGYNKQTFVYLGTEKVLATWDTGAWRSTVLLM